MKHVLRLAELRFFADSLTSFFETLIPLSESLLAGNPATAGAQSLWNTEGSIIWSLWCTDILCKSVQHLLHIFACPKMFEAWRASLMFVVCYAFFGLCPLLLILRYALIYECPRQLKQISTQQVAKWGITRIRSGFVWRGSKCESF